MTKLIEGMYPYEETIYFLVCELLEGYGLMALSGYKTRLLYASFPKESVSNGYRMGISIIFGLGKATRQNIIQSIPRWQLVDRQWFNNF